MVNGGSCQPERASLWLLRPFGVTNSGKPTGLRLFIMSIIRRACFATARPDSGITVTPSGQAHRLVDESVTLRVK
jgi:hypothetical protein